MQVVRYPCGSSASAKCLQIRVPSTAEDHARPHGAVTLPQTRVISGGVTTMFSVTVDAFSGRPNPTYVIGDDESREFLRDLPQAAISDTATRFDGLGFRGVVVEARTDDMTDARVDLPPRFVVGGGTAVDEDAASEFVERLIRGLRDHETVGLTAPTEDLIAYLLDLARRRPSARTFPDIAPTTPPSPAAIAKAVTCWIERSKFNPGFWNAADVVGR